jgi:polysaccharide biosynthesis protein PslH
MDIVLISPVWPFDPKDGHTLAVLSDIHAIVDSGLQPGIITFCQNGENRQDTDFPTTVVPVREGGFATRFLRGLFSHLPPSVERLYHPEAYRRIRESLLTWKPKLVILDDSLVSGYATLIRDLLPGVKLVLRSHNVMHDVRLAQLNRTQGITRPAVRMDCERYIEFERKAVANCDAHWAITQADADRMKALYGRSTDCLGVSLPLEKYELFASRNGRRNSFAHVGTMDFRRRSDLFHFLNSTWPKVLEADPEATLTLAGALYGDPIPASNVTYSGRVDSDADIYRDARFAVNFQSSTGGLKIKTLTSLAAGRILLSTAQGVEGLPLTSGEHYLDIESFISSPCLRSLLRDGESTKSVADAGRQYVETHHCRAAIAYQFQTLVNTL